MLIFATGLDALSAPRWLSAWPLRFLLFSPVKPFKQCLVHVFHLFGSAIGKYLERQATAAHFDDQPFLHLTIAEADPDSRQDRMIGLCWPSL